MSCRKPITALYFGTDPETGKKLIKLKRPFIDESLADFRKRYGSNHIMLLPCGHCLPCLIKKRKEWSIRCLLESFYHEKNCFITLTYDNAHYFNSVKTVLSDKNQFIKDLRNKGLKFRYFGCVERGDLNRRLHMHIAFFGFVPDDLKLYDFSNSNNPMYLSKFIESIWNKGLVRVEDFGFGVGNYIAGYTSKKLGDPDGRIFMSNRPGIGYQYLKDNMLDLAHFNKICDDLGSVKFAALPRYFTKLADLNGVDLPYKNLSSEIADDVRCTEMQLKCYDHEEFLYKDNCDRITKKTKKLFVRSV